MNKFGISKDTLKKIINTISKNENVEKALIFGSRANNTHKNHSDIDIAVIGENLSMDDYLKIRFKLDDLPLLYKIDVVKVDNTLDKKIKDSIFKQGIEIYKKGD